MASSLNATLQRGFQDKGEEELCCSLQQNCLMKLTNTCTEGAVTCAVSNSDSVLQIPIICRRRMRLSPSLLL